MIVTLYKNGKDGKIRYYTIHDRQASLTSPYALTLAWRTGNGREREKLHLFENLADMDRMIKSVIATRYRDGYRLLYSWSRDASWSDVSESSASGDDSGTSAKSFLAKAEAAQHRLAIG